MSKVSLVEGTKFGYLTYTGEDNGKRGLEKRYRFVCQCGNEKWLKLSKVTSGHTKSCGCMSSRKTRFDVSSLLPYIDPSFPEDAELIRSGKFKMDDRVHVLCRKCGSPLSFRALKHFFFRMEHFCMCRSCTMKEVSIGGRTGVVRDSENVGLKKGNPRLYNIWKNMMNRCYKETSNVFYLYGGRGIHVCEEWKKARTFFEWAMSSGYENTLTLDRRDSCGNYTPENCRWVTNTEQNRNKRCTRYIGTVDSKTFFESTPHDPSVTYLRFFMRYFKGGWSLQDALNIPNEGRLGKPYRMLVDDVSQIFQRDVREFIKTSTKSSLSYDTIINGFRTSVCVHDMHVAFHIVGTHNSAELPRNFCRNSFVQCLEAGYRLITIFECDWIVFNEECKRLIKESLTPQRKLYARSLSVELVSKNDAKKFFDSNHFERHSSRGFVSYALKSSEGSFVAMMSFGHLRGQNPLHKNKACFELVRYATASGTVVVGGASRLLSAFIKEFSPSIILSYSDNDFFTGGVYDKLGFTKLDVGQCVDYVWFDGKTILKRYVTTVKRLEKGFPELCDEAREKCKGVEDYVMHSRGFVKVYRCGNSRWLMMPSQSKPFKTEVSLS